MAEYKIFFKNTVWKDFESIRKKELREILQRIELLEENPCPTGSQKLSGEEKHRIRHGRYRIVYSTQNEELTVWIVKVGHRKEIYRRSEPLIGADA